MKVKREISITYLLTLSEDNYYEYNSKKNIFCNTKKKAKLLISRKVPGRLAETD